MTPITVLNFGHSVSSDEMNAALDNHFKSLPNAICIVNAWDTEYLTYAEKKLVAPHWVWTIQLSRAGSARYLDHRGIDYIGKTQFVDWVKESYPDSFEWLLFNQRFLQ